MSLFRYFSLESGLKTLSTSELMVTPPKYLNDVFECSPVIRCEDPWGYTVSQLGGIIGSPAWFTQNRAHFPNLTFEQFQAGMKQHAPDLAQKMVAEIPAIDLELQTKMVDLISEKFGVVCFTPDVTHQKMWGIYGASHSGVAIEFDEKHQLFSGRSFVKMGYSDTAVIFDASNPNNRDDAELFLTRKKLDWSYERESRLIVDLSFTSLRDMASGPRYVLPVGPELIMSVTLGLRTDDDVLAKVLRALREPRFQHVELFKIQKDVAAGVLKRVRL